MNDCSQQVRKHKLREVSDLACTCTSAEGSSEALLAVSLQGKMEHLLIPHTETQATEQTLLPEAPGQTARMDTWSSQWRMMVPFLSLKESTAAPN